MLFRICLLSVLAMGPLAGPALSDDGAGPTGNDRSPIVLAQLQRFITPKKPHLQPAVQPAMQPARPPCPNYFAAC